MTIDAPAWDLDSALSELDSTPQDAAQRLELWITALGVFFDEHHIAAGPPLDGTPDLATPFDDVVARTDPLLRLERILSCWHAGRCWADAADTTAATDQTCFQQHSAGLAPLASRLNAWTARLPLPWLLEHTKHATGHLPWLERCRQITELPAGQTDLLTELDIHGRDALIAVYAQLSALANAPFNHDPNVPIALLQPHLSSPDPQLRRAAHTAIDAAWTSLDAPSAVCLNAVTGREWALARRTGQPDLARARLAREGITPAALEALHHTVIGLLPTLRAFTRTKARLLGLPQLNYWDLAAPLPDTQTLTWNAAASYVTSAFAQFCPQLGAHAREAVARRWIDGQIRPGKRPRALCLPLTGSQSRIMCSFDGSYDSMYSLAHELGHGFQHRCHDGHTEWQRAIPVSVAEISSMFCETLLPRASETPQQHLEMLHANLIGTFQTIACGYARYAFEHAMLMRRRPVPAGELSEMALDAQRTVFQDAFTDESLPTHLWISQSHLYTTRLSAPSYYFGMLFALSVLDPNARGAAEQFTELLALTGTMTTGQLAEHFGHDLASPGFWRRGAEHITRRVTEFTNLAGHILAPGLETAGMR